MSEVPRYDAQGLKFSSLYQETRFWVIFSTEQRGEKLDSKALTGIGLACRRDYEINRGWARFGFEAVGEKLGRGKDRMMLTLWWFSHGHPDLFSAEERDEPKIQVVIDANVLFELGRLTAASEDSRATWLGSWRRFVLAWPFCGWNRMAA